MRVSARSALLIAYAGNGQVARIVSSGARLVVSRAEDAWAGRTDRAGQATKESRVYAVDLVGATSKERM